MYLMNAARIVDLREGNVNAGRNELNSMPAPRNVPLSGLLILSRREYISLENVAHAI